MVSHATQGGNAAAGSQWLSEHGIKIHHIHGVIRLLAKIVQIILIDHLDAPHGSIQGIVARQEMLQAVACHRRNQGTDLKAGDAAALPDAKACHDSIRSKAQGTVQHRHAFLQPHCLSHVVFFS